jgi:hypothetical protein
MDYRSKDGLFTVSASCVTIPNPNSFSSPETGFNPGIKIFFYALFPIHDSNI